MAEVVLTITRLVHSEVVQYIQSGIGSHQTVSTLHQKIPKPELSQTRDFNRPSIAPSRRISRRFYIGRKNPKVDPQLLFGNPYTNLPRFPKFSIYSNKLITAPPTLSMIAQVLILQLVSAWLY